MPAGSFISGLLGGFAQSAAASRKEAQDLAEQKAAREDKLLQIAMTSDDEDIKRAAFEGLTTPGPRKKGFLDNLFGSVPADNPAFAHINALISAGKQIPAEPGLPVHGGLPQPPPQAPGGASAAMPQTSGAQRPPSPSQLGSPSGPPTSLPVTPTVGLPQTTPQPQVGSVGAQPGRTVPRVLFKSAEEKAADLIRAQDEAKVHFAAAHGATPEMQRGIATSLAGGAGMLTPHNLPGLIPASAAIGETDQSGHVITEADQAAGKRYRETWTTMGGRVLREEAAPVSSMKPQKVVTMVDPVTHQPDTTGTSKRRGTFLLNPAEKDPTKAYTFIGFTDPGPREQAFPFQWEDEQGIHRELVYGEAKFDQGVSGPPSAGSTGPPPSGQGTQAAPAVTPPPSARTTTPPPAKGGGTAGAGITRVPVGTSPPKMAIAHARLPSGAYVSAIRNPMAPQKLIDPKTGQPLEGATEATAQDVAKQQDAMANLGTIYAGLQDIKNLTEKVYPPGSGIGGALQAGATLFSKRHFTHDPDLAKLTSRVSLSAGPIARIIEMSNRMNLATVARAAKALGDTDTGLLTSSSQQEALAKIQAVTDALNEQVDQMGIVIDPNGQPHQFATRDQMNAFKARIAQRTTGGR